MGGVVLREVRDDGETGFYIDEQDGQDFWVWRRRDRHVAMLLAVTGVRGFPLSRERQWVMLLALVGR